MSKTKETANVYYTEYAVGDIVYLKTDPDKNARIINAIQLTDAGTLYRLGFGTSDCWQTAIEFDYDKKHYNY